MATLYFNLRNVVKRCTCHHLGMQSVLSSNLIWKVNILLFKYFLLFSLFCFHGNHIFHFKVSIKKFEKKNSIFSILKDELCSPNTMQNCHDLMDFNF